MTMRTRFRGRPSLRHALARKHMRTRSKKLIGCCLCSLNPPQPLSPLQHFTGLRRSEIRGLIWENYTGQELRVTRSIWNSIADEPKTEKSKAPVPVISQLPMMLDLHRTTCGNPKIGPIFVNELGKAQCLNNLANRSILPILHRCAKCRKNREEHKDSDHQFKLNTSCVNWRGWHAFRRGLATNLNRLGVPAKTIPAILRHANLNTTMNVYVKSVDQDS